jgi:hypothetical protein
MFAEPLPRSSRCRWMHAHRSTTEAVMKTHQTTTHTLGTTARWVLVLVAVTVLLGGAAIGSSGAAESNVAWPDHLLQRDEHAASDDHVWPDHLVDPHAAVQVAAFVWPDHLVERDAAAVATDHVWPDHLVVRPGDVVVAE